MLLSEVPEETTDGTNTFGDRARPYRCASQRFAQESVAGAWELSINGPEGR